MSANSFTYEKYDGLLLHLCRSIWSGIGLFITCVVCITLICLSSVASAAAPAAGTVIENSAAASYYNPVIDRSETIRSNVVTITILPVESLSLVANQQLVRTSGALVTFPHTLTNTGNTASSVSFTLASLPASDFSLLDVSMFDDSNANGVADSSESAIPTGGTVSLAPGVSKHVIITAKIPTTVLQGHMGGISLTATTIAQRATAVVKDTVTIELGAHLELLKSSSQLAPKPGDTVLFSLRATNTGNETAYGGPLSGGAVPLINGVPASMILLRDTVPANCRYVPGSFVSSSEGTRLYHKKGDPQFSYLTNEPETVDEVALAVSTVEPGRQISVRFEVTINGNASGQLVNTGYANYRSGTAGVMHEGATNTVSIPLPDLPPAISFYSDSTFAKTSDAMRLGSPLFIQADAPRCNSNPLVVEERVIIVTSTKTGDTESFLARESEPNSGIFQVADIPTKDAALSAVVQGNSIVESLKHDQLFASISGCGSSTVKTRILIDPGGIVFDSRSNQAVSGAVVSIIDTATGVAAEVFELDGITRHDSQVTTDADGSFEFPLVKPGMYQLLVTPPNGWKFPSQFSASQLPSARVIVDGSYGMPFPVNAATGPVYLDVPLDPAAAGGLFVQKSASRTTVEIADVLDYTIRVKNNSGKTLTNVILTDNLPFGFSYQKGTVRKDGAVISDPAGGGGPKLSWNLGTLPVGVVIEVKYRVKVGIGAHKGDGINRAQATADYGTVSNSASAKVRIEQGVFTDKGVVIGKVYVDCDRNRLQGEKEPGIPGVRIYMEDGTFAVTDSEGKYSFYGVSPRTHVLKLDETTLPTGSELEVLGNRHAGDAASQFVDLKIGELFRADFAEGSCNDEVMNDVRQRRMKGEVYTPETKRRLETKLTLEEQALQLSEIKSRPASGLMVPETRLPYFSPVISAEENRHWQRPASTEPVSEAHLQDYTEQMAAMDSKPGFIDLKHGDILPSAQTTIRVKGTAGAQTRLLVNGAEIEESRIGKKIVVEDQKLEAREYIGVTLKPGENRLELLQADQFGNPRGSASITVVAPGMLASIELVVPQGDIPADGQTPVVVKVRLVDGKGVAVTSRTPLTLESSLGRWDVKDLSEQEPGVQVFVEGGSAEFRLVAPADPGMGAIRVSTSNISARESVSFVPDLRPLIAAGVVEGTLNLRRLDLGAITPTRSQDGFEQELRTISSSNDKRLNASGRAAFFLKGKIKGDYLLTMSYDSDKDTREKLFRDINPDEFYPVYGDSSVRGFDAQSTGRFYVRVDKKRSYLLYGDFTTQTASEARSLGAYNRSLTGVRAHFENSLLSASGFASQDKSRQVVDELPALGVSGPYYLRTADLVANSEKIEIITRDRNQPSLILKSVPMSRFSDYEIEDLTGRILFKEPINSRDSNLNIVSIRVTYEVYQGGPEFWVAGGDLQFKPHDRLEIGGSYVRDENPLDRMELGSVNATLKIAEKTFLLAEWARISRQTTGEGDGKRVEVRHDSENLTAKLYASKTDASFDNPSASITRGRNEIGAKARYSLSKMTALSTEALFSEDAVTMGSRKGVIVNLEHAVARYIKGELGVRYARETAAPSQSLGSATLTPTENTSIRAKLGMQLPFYTKIGLFGEYEQSVDAADRRTVAFGGDYQFAPQSRLYARHELISGLAGQFSLNGSQQRNTTLIGVESEYMKDGHLFSEYRMRDSISGRDSEAAVGLRNGWQLTSGIRLTTNLERITTLGGAIDNDSTAVGAGIEYTGSNRWKGSSRLEYRTGVTSYSYLGTMGAAYKYNRSVTLLGRQIVSYTQNKGSLSGLKIQQRTQIGAAYRPVDSNRWNLLSKYEFRYEDDDTNPLQSSTRIVHILSTSLNFQPARSLVVSGRYAAKLVFDESGPVSSRSSAHMVTGRLTYDLTKKWDVGLNAMALFNETFSSVLYGAGNEVGYLMTANLWVSAGYNYFGFFDKDLSGEDYTNPGMFVRMRFKFDEHLFDGFGKNSLRDGQQK